MNAAYGRFIVCVATLYVCLLSAAWKEPKRSRWIALYILMALSMTGLYCGFHYFAAQPDESGRSNFFVPMCSIIGAVLFGILLVFTIVGHLTAGRTEEKAEKGKTYPAAVQLVICLAVTALTFWAVFYLLPCYHTPKAMRNILTSTVVVLIPGFLCSLPYWLLKRCNPYVVFWGIPVSGLTLALFPNEIALWWGMKLFDGLDYLKFYLASFSWPILFAVINFWTLSCARRLLHEKTG